MRTRKILDRLTGAIRTQLRNGRSQQAIAGELGLSQTLLGAAARGKRRLGRDASSACP